MNRQTHSSRASILAPVFGEVLEGRGSEWTAILETGCDEDMKRRESPSVRLIIANPNGHRAQYLEVLLRLLPNSVRAPVPPPLRTLCWTHNSLFFLTLDDHSLAFLATAALRSALGRRTAALFLRPAECFRPGRWKYQLKRLLFRAVSKMPGVVILTILPFSVEPRFAEVATGWIDDPQFWDMSVFDVPQTESADQITERVEETAAGRAVVLALGGQNRIKGFDFFSRLWCGSARIREKFLFCAAGAVAPEEEAAKGRFCKAGGLVIDRRLENEELLRLYEHANAVWSCYAPDYDQASGIFGRAVQFGVPSLVRSGSFLEKLASEHDHRHLAMPFDDLETAGARLLSWRPEKRQAGDAQARAETMRERSIDILRRALYE